MFLRFRFLFFRFQLVCLCLLMLRVLCVVFVRPCVLDRGCRVCCCMLSMRRRGCLRCCCRRGLVRLGGLLWLLVCRTMRTLVGRLVGVCGCVGIRGLSMRSLLPRFAWPSASLALVAIEWHGVGHVSGLSVLFVFYLSVCCKPRLNAVCPRYPLRLIVAQFALALAHLFLCRVFTRLSDGLTNRC